MINWPVFCGYCTDGLWWFRVFGYGIAWKNTKKHKLLFSERVLGHGLLIQQSHFSILTPQG